MEVDLFDIFCLGVDYGQLLMEENKENENVFNAFLGSVHAKKYSQPLKQPQGRQVHSAEWFAAKRKSKADFFELINKIGTDKIEL